MASFSDLPEVRARGRAGCKPSDSRLPYGLPSIPLAGPEHPQGGKSEFLE